MACVSQNCTANPIERYFKNITHLSSPNTNIDKSLMQNDMSTREIFGLFNKATEESKVKEQEKEANCSKLNDLIKENENFKKERENSDKEKKNLKKEIQSSKLGTIFLSFLFGIITTISLYYIARFVTKLIG
jgi:hypothetical protein